MSDGLGWTAPDRAAAALDAIGADVATTLEAWADRLRALGEAARARLEEPQGGRVGLLGGDPERQMEALFLFRRISEVMDGIGAARKSERDRILAKEIETALAPLNEIANERATSLVLGMSHMPENSCRLLRAHFGPKADPCIIAGDGVRWTEGTTKYEGVVGLVQDGQVVVKDVTAWTGASGSRRSGFMVRAVDEVTKR
jgi:hypothetical protein